MFKRCLNKVTFIERGKCWNVEHFLLRVSSQPSKIQLLYNNIKLLNKEYTINKYIQIHNTTLIDLAHIRNDQRWNVQVTKVFYEYSWKKKLLEKTPYEVCNRCFHELTGQYIRLQTINGIKNQQKRHWLYKMHFDLFFCLKINLFLN